VLSGRFENGRPKLLEKAPCPPPTSPSSGSCIMGATDDMILDSGRDLDGSSSPLTEELSFPDRSSCCVNPVACRRPIAEVEIGIVEDDDDITSVAADDNLDRCCCPNDAEGPGNVLISLLVVVESLAELRASLGSLRNFESFIFF
jgi:hypothetical protein